MKVSQPEFRLTSIVGRTPRGRAIGSRVGWGRRPAKVVGAGQDAGGVRAIVRISSMSEKPARDRPRRLADWPNPAGCNGGPFLREAGYQVEGLGDHSIEECRARSGSPRVGLTPESQAPRPVRPSGLAGACAPALPESFVAPVSWTHLCESWMRENRT